MQTSADFKFIELIQFDVSGIDLLTRSFVDSCLLAPPTSGRFTATGPAPITNTTDPTYLGFKVGSLGAAIGTFLLFPFLSHLSRNSPCYYHRPTDHHWCNCCFDSHEVQETTRIR